METRQSAGPEAERGGRGRRNWKRIALAVVMAFVVFSVGRSVLPALGIHVPGGRSHSAPGTAEPTTAKSAPPPAVNLDGVPVLHASSALVERATRIALDLDHPVYDCIYIACAEAIGGVLITADEKMMRTAENTKFQRLMESLDLSARGSA